MALFSAPRYLGDDENEDGIKKVMTLDELHHLAEQRLEQKKQLTEQTVIYTESALPTVTSVKFERRKEKKRKIRHREDSELLLDNVTGNESDVLSNEEEREGKEEMWRKHRKVKEDSDQSGNVIDQVEQQQKKRKKGKKQERRGCTEDDKPNEIALQNDIEISFETKTENEEAQEELNPLPVLTRPPLRKTSQRVHYQLPDWVTQYCHIEEDVIKHSLPLSDFSIPFVIKKNLLTMGVTKFFPVQCSVIPELMKGCYGPLLLTRTGITPSDLCVCAPTGCGKTLSYVVPIISALTGRVNTHLKALIVVPSKDLALQVFEVFNSISQGTGVKVGVVCSQSSLECEQQNIVSPFGSEIDVLVTTPGRLVTHLQETPFFSLTYLRFLVIDEADRIFEQSYQSWLSHVLQATKEINKVHSPFTTLISTSSLPLLFPTLWKPLLSNSQDIPMACGPCKSNQTLCTQNILKPQQPLQKLLFSATLSLDPEHLSLLQLHSPKLYSVAPVISEQLGESILPLTLKEYKIECTSDHKPLVLVHLLVTLTHQRVLCFTHSKESTHRLVLLLQQYNQPVAEISMQSSQGVRANILKKFKAGMIKVSNDI